MLILNDGVGVDTKEPSRALRPEIALGATSLPEMLEKSEVVPIIRNRLW
jgi:hypothetical protein